MKHTVKYELKNGFVLKDGHTMFIEDIVTDLKRKAHLENITPDLIKGIGRMIRLREAVINSQVVPYESELETVKIAKDAYKKAIK